MKFSEDTTDGYRIEAYDAESLTIGGRRYHRALALSAERLVADWGPDRPEALQAAHIAELLETDPQLILLGTGQVQRLLPLELQAPALTRGIGIEVMSTPAACRTYNILHAEGRRVVAGLLIG